MSNMSYCRFQNTLRDLQDCAGVMEEGENEIRKLSSEEKRAFVSMMDVCSNMLAAIGIDVDSFEVDRAVSELLDGPAETDID